MNLSEQTFLDLLLDVDSKSDNQDFYSLKEKDNGYLTSVQMAHLYTSSALLVTIMGFLKEQLWLNDKEDKKTGVETSYTEFLSPFFNDELLSVVFLKDFLIKSGSLNIKKVTRNSEDIEKSILSMITSRSSDDQKDFMVQSLKEMTVHFLKEEQEKEGRTADSENLGLRLYRTFDNLDDIFKFNYNLDSNMEVDHTAKERLYQGGGVGVQSGYSTILLALTSIETKQCGKIIDLGSGYGRVGLVCSLLRPDINFIGYEFVPHRVELGNKASESLHLEEKLTFEVQDLSLESFKIPEADVYYLYDPFTKETYHYVLNQIVEFSKNKKITIVTKGNARKWLIDVANENSWPEPEFIDERNLCVFRSA